MPRLRLHQILTSFDRRELRGASVTIEGAAIRVLTKIRARSFILIKQSRIHNIWIIVFMDAGSFNFTLKEQDS